MKDTAGIPLFETPVMRKLTDTLETLKPAQRKVADFILRNPLRAAMLSISEIGRESGTSPAAVNRLGNKMGMNGFTGLRNALINHLLAVISPQAPAAPQAPEVFSLEHQLNLAHGELALIRRHNSTPMLDEVLHALAGAREVYVVGAAQCCSLVHLTAAQLDTLNRSCQTVTLASGLEPAVSRLLHAGEQDVVLMFSLPPYHPEVEALATLVARQGAQVISITDSPAAPVARATGKTLFAPVGPKAKGSGLWSAFTLVDTLIAGLRHRDQGVDTRTHEQMREAVRLVEDARDHLQQGAQAYAFGRTAR